MKNQTSRRNFLKYLGLGGLGITTLPSIVKTKENTQVISEKTSHAWFKNLAVEHPKRSFTQKPIDMKVGIQPVSSTRVHESSYEGPCRFGCDECLSHETEKEASKERAERMREETNKKIDKKYAKVLPVARVEFSEGDRLEQKYFDRLGKNMSEVDLFLSNYRVPGIEEFKKPFAIPTHGVTNVDTAAYMKSIGLEGYAPYDWEEVNYLIRLMQARKAVYNTRILNVSNNPHRKPQGVYSSTTYPIIKDRYGIDYEVVDYEELFNKLEEIRNDQSRQSMSKKISQELLNNAGKSNMELQAVQYSVDFYLAIKELMEKYDCNAFTVKCFELCNTKLPEKYKIVPCLTHSLLKDEGYPSFCEGDLNAGLALTLSEYVSKKSVHMGNPVFLKGENKIFLHHSEPGRKLKGLDKPDVPYQIISFTNDLWGATLRYDFSRDKGKVVTLSRFHPSGEKMMLTKGKILSAENVNKIGCALRTYISMNNEMELMQIQSEFGHHMAMVLGDYTQELKDVARMMNVEVVEYENEV